MGIFAVCLQAFILSFVSRAQYSRLLRKPALAGIQDFLTNGLIHVLISENVWKDKNDAIANAQSAISLLANSPYLNVQKRY